MLRVRGAGPVALSLALILVVLATSLAVAAPRRSDAVSAAAGPAVEPLAAAAWPVSSLVVSEVQTGGASASDEFAELYNGGPLAAELMGLELVYATSTGSTVTRKATWTTSTILEPGRHLLIANAAGVYAAQADATYSGGFAATLMTFAPDALSNLQSSVKYRSASQPRRCLPATGARLGRRAG